MMLLLVVLMVIIVFGRWGRRSYRSRSRADSSGFDTYISSPTSDTASHPPACDSSDSGSDGGGCDSGSSD